VNITRSLRLLKLFTRYGVNKICRTTAAGKHNAFVDNVEYVRECCLKKDTMVQTAQTDLVTTLVGVL